MPLRVPSTLGIDPLRTQLPENEEQPINSIYGYVYVTDREEGLIIVPVGTPGVDIVRDVSTMEDPHTPYGRFGNHAEIIYRDVRIPAGNLVGREGDGFQLAQQRLVGEIKLDISPSGTAAGD